MQEATQAQPQYKSELVKAERKELERTLLKTREVLQILFDRTVHPNAIVDSEGNCVHCNDAMLRFLEVTHDELLTKNLRDLFSPGKEGQGIEEYKPLLKSGGIKEVQHRVNGKVKTLKLTISPAVWQGQRAAFCIGEDISEVRQAEESLKNSEAKLRSLVDQSTDGIIVTDEQGAIVEWNPGEERITGLKKTDAVGLPLWQIMKQLAPEELRSPQFVKQIKAAFYDLLKTGRALSLSQAQEATIQRPDGTRRIIEETVFPIKLGRHIMVAAFMRDITRRKQAERDLNERLKELSCLYAIANIVKTPEITLDEVYQQVVNLLASGLQYPETASAKINFGGNEFKTENHKETEWKLSSDIKINGARAGTVEITYLEKKPDNDEGPFMKEEHLLLGAVAERLGRIAERNLAQEGLKVSEERYRSLTEGVLDSSSVGLIILDSDFRVVWINHAMEQFFGLHRDKVIGMDKKWLVQRRIKHLFQDPESFAERVLATYKDNTYIANFECHVLGNDEREERWLEHWSQPIKFGVYVGGRAEYYYDVTQRKHMEEALRQSEEKSRTMLDHMDEGYYEMDLAGNLTFFNETYCRGLGYSREELIGANYRRVIFEEDADRMYELFLQLYRTGELVEGISCRAVRKDGSIIFIESSANPLRNERGEIIRFRGIGRDITTQRRMEQQLDGLVKNTLDAQEAERERICLDVHDGVTQTMASTFQYLQTLGTTLPEDIPGRQLLLKAESLVKQSIRESREVINSLQPATLKGLGLIPTLRQELRQLRRETGWRVGFSVNATKLPSTIEMGLYRIIHEALANIRKHAKSNRVRVEITSANGQVTVWVKDWGIGFDPEHIDMGERKTIGLLSMRKRAELLQGTCDIQSTLGQGTTVCVKIPTNDFF